MILNRFPSKLMQVRKSKYNELNACYVGQVDMHQGRHAFNKTWLLKLWRVLIFKAFERFTLYGPQ
jgi:uncharacterized membrane protein